MSGAQPTAKQVQAQQAVQQAMDGDLPRVGKHTVTYNTSYRTVLPQVFFENVPIEPGDEGEMYMDIQNQFIVIDYSGGD